MSENLMSEWQLTTPVALFVFNRPDTAGSVFAAIRQVRPVRLLLVADGPRSDRPGEDALCRQARAVMDLVDWPCKVETNYSDVNLGCGQRISSGLDWVFERVEEAIILEDDCLPDLSFFRFCSELLERYRDNPRIAQISGVNYQSDRNGSSGSYYFSRYNHCWGWAAWRRSWQVYDREMKAWPSYRDSNGLSRVLPKRREVLYWTRILDRVASGEIDTWDYQWTLSCWRHHMITIIPTVNLVSNIGFGPNATHTTASQCTYANLPTDSMKFALVHPSVIEVNNAADEYTSRLVYRDLTFVEKVRIVLNKLFSSLAGRRDA